MPELREAIDDLGKAFTDFKKANDERLKEIEKKGSADPLLEEKVNRIGEVVDACDKIKQRLDEVEKKLNRPGTGSGKTEEQVLKEQHKAAFLNFIRTGKNDELEALRGKAVNIGTPGEGGYAHPEELDRSIYSLLQDISPIRAISGNVKVSTNNYEKLVSTHGATSGWVGETTARSETTSPGLASVTPPMGEIYANPASTQRALDDIFFDVEGWLREEVSTEFAQEEGAAFVSGNGTNKPKGFLAYTTAATADSSRAFGTLEHVATGGSGAWPTSNPSDVLIDLIYKLKAGHRQGARFVMNKGVLAAVRKFKDGQGDYLWSPGLEAGQPSMLLGYPVTEAEDMPAIAANSLSVAFGNFQRGYLVVDRIGVRVLRDPYTNKPYVHFYSTMRVGGGVIDSEAIKLLKFAAS